MRSAPSYPGLVNEDEFVVTSPHFDDFQPELVPLPDLSDMPLSSDESSSADSDDHLRSIVAEETWHEARLIPTSGISGGEEQERRATSAVLAVMTSVREFGRALTKPLGWPGGRLATYIEVPFMLGEARCYPDGLIRLTHGKQSRTALGGCPEFRGTSVAVR